MLTFVCLFSMRFGRTMSIEPQIDLTSKSEIRVTRSVALLTKSRSRWASTWRIWQYAPVMRGAWTNYKLINHGEWMNGRRMADVLPKRKQLLVYKLNDIKFVRPRCRGKVLKNSLSRALITVKFVNIKYWLKRKLIKITTQTFKRKYVRMRYDNLGISWLELVRKKINKTGV